MQRTQKTSHMKQTQSKNGHELERYFSKEEMVNKYMKKKF